MLPRPYRLAKARDVYRVVRSRQAVRGRFLTIRYLEHPQGERRFTVVVSTKVAKRATARNRLKRQLRALISGMMQRFPDRTDYLLQVKPTTPLPGRDDLMHDLQSILRRLTPQP